MRAKLKTGTDSFGIAINCANLPESTMRPSQNRIVLFGGLTLVACGAMAIMAHAQDVTAIPYRIEGACRQRVLNQIMEPETGAEIYNTFDLIPGDSIKSTVRSCASDTNALFNFQKRNVQEKLGLSFQGMKGETVRLTATSMNPLNCAILENPGVSTKLGIMHSAIKSRPIDDIDGFSLLSFIQLDANNKPRILLGQFLSIDSPYDIVRHVDVEHICDLDADRLAEIILKDQAYAGYGYLVLKFNPDFSKMSETQVSGASGD